MFLIVGLGNPGEKYSKTRHNLGFEVVDEFARKHVGGSAWQMEEKFRSEVIKAIYPQYATSHNLILAKPQTYMNNSGMAISKLVSFFKIAPADLVVIHDELDLPLGHIKLRLGGAAAGHHGVESVIKALGSDKFVRIRLGIGNLASVSGEHKHRAFNAEHFVLESFLPQESSTVKRMIRMSLKALDIFLNKGLDKAQNQFN
ncbi:aminoacyl-tRNA hydrolase [Candidatus Daviesbacteria bacterium]|nr:aminoacyl-tRNA hydrolase [Candidatus Daviesbacteria bacterium]